MVYPASMPPMVYLASLPHGLQTMVKLSQERTLVTSPSFAMMMVTGVNHGHRGAARVVQNIQVLNPTPKNVMFDNASFLELHQSPVSFLDGKRIQHFSIVLRVLFAF